MGDPDVEWDPFKDFGIWTDAFSQAYFTTGFCTGAVVVLGSFRKKESSLIKENYYLFFLDIVMVTIYGICGFALKGFLKTIDSPVASRF